MGEYPTEPDLEVSLEPFEPTSLEAKSQAIVDRAIRELLRIKDFSGVSDAKLDKVDQVQVYRSNYILSLIRFGQYMREQAPNHAALRAQAQLATSFIRMTDANLQARLQLGRSRADEKLKDEVAELRAQLKQITEQRARALNAKPNGTKKANQSRARGTRPSAKSGSAT